MAKNSPAKIQRVVDSTVNYSYQLMAEQLMDGNSVLPKDAQAIIRGKLGPIAYEEFKKFVKDEVTFEE